MKTIFTNVLSVMLLSSILCGCASLSEKNGQFQVNVTLPSSADGQMIRYYIDGLVVETTTGKSLVCSLTPGSHTLKIHVSGAKTYKQHFEIHGFPNTQVLSVFMESK
jgi:hypothetical protein